MAPQVGAKACNLARLLRLGLPVPAGFCVTVTAYREHLARIGLADRLHAAIEAARQSDATGKQKVLAELRQAIIAGVLPVEFRIGFERQFQSLAGFRFAVRSSSTAEDLPGLSFAGLYDTTLLKTDVWGCLDAVKKSWASLWSVRAFDYREKNRVDHINAGMCVIVQKMISAEAAGVMFTADPASGARDRIVIEASFGLGEGIVSGKVAPDRLVLARDRLHVLERNINTKTVEMVFTEQWGVKEWPVEPERQAKPAIDDQLARRLGKMALAVERAFGSPQDIEWAIAGKSSGANRNSSFANRQSANESDLFLLQARPITTLAGRGQKEERQVWTNVNLAETLPDAAPPMTLSLAEEVIRGVFGWILKMGGIEPRDIRLFGYIAGRPYINLNVFIGMIRSLPFVNRMKLSELFGGMRDDLAPRREDVPLVKANRVKFLLGLPGLIVWFLKNQPGHGRRAAAALRTRTDELQRRDYARLSEAELPREVTFGLEQLFASTDELGGAMTGMQYYSMLFDRCRKWFNDPESTVASHLLSSLGDINSAQAGLELWRLADMAGARPDLRALVMSGEPWAELRAKLNGVELGDEFVTRWDDLMFHHGHHCRGEFDLIKPRWSEQPDFVLGSIRSLLEAGDRLDPERDFERRAAERDDFANQCRQRLRNPFKRMMFNFLLKQAQLGASVRENVRDESNRRIALARCVLLELGQRLVRRDILAQPDDIFFLYRHELEPVRQGSQAFDVRNTIADRRLEYQRNLGITPPSTIVGTFNPDTFQPEPIPENAETLSGLAVSPGIATGPARVITRYSVDAQVLPGEILVAPFTDPGWTPYFLPAAGIVVDIGGLLSHGSIVAREYGKPAVVNVGPATRIIKTGQMVQVDGNQGKVRILR